MISASEAIENLVEGNRRFISGAGNAGGIEQSCHARLIELLAGQEPFAIISGSSDSRVPAEIIFDQGLGELFVICVAGNIVAPSQRRRVFTGDRYR